jgi:osmoprotectant transport system substrate-binding protein
VTPRYRRLTVALLAVLLGALLMLAAACGGSDSSSSGGPGDGVTVRLADKGFAESFIVTQAYAKALENQGFATDVTSLGSTEIADKAVRDGEIDVYPEYIGTVWQNILERTPADAPATPEAQLAEIQTAYAKVGLVALDAASPFSNGNAVACTQEAVDKYGITDLTALGKASANIVYSANAEHLTRPDGLPLLRREYGFDPKEIKTVDISLRYKPIEDGQANCVYAFGTDPKIAELGLVLIPDDKGTYSAGLSYKTFPVVNKDFYDGLTDEQRTAFDDALSSASAALTQDVIIAGIKRVQDNEDPDVVANDILVDAGVSQS